MKKKNTEGYIPLPEAIKRLRDDPDYSWWPETSIRDAVRDGHIPSTKASLRRKAKYFVRMEDIKEHLKRLKVERVEPEITVT